MSKLSTKRLYSEIQTLKKKVDNTGGGTDLTGDVTLNTNSSNVTTVAGQLTASVGLNLGGDLTLNEYIRRSGDSDTNIRFTEDDINITAGGANMLDFTQADSGQDEITFNEGGTDIDFRVESADESHMLFIEASSNRMSIGDNTGSPGATLEIKNHNSAGATGVPLLQLNNNDTDKQCLDINASNITANVVNVTANDVTTARVLAIGADGLTTGNAFYVDDNSADTGTRKTALIIQNNAAAINAQALTVQSDGGKIGVNIDKNYSDTTEASIVGLNIDWDKTGASTSDNTMYGIQLDMDNTTATNGNNTMYGLHVTPTLTHAANAGTPIVYGALINAQGGTNGTSLVQGMRVEAGGGDINYGIQLDVEDGGVDLRIESSADSGDYFQIQTTTHGATTITTVDDDAAAANLTFNIDGNFVVTGSGKVGINTDTPMNRMQINHFGSDGDDGLLIVRKDADSHVYTGDLLGGIGIDAADGNVPSSILEASAYIAAFAAENFDNNNKGGNLAFGCTLIDDNDDTTSHEYMRITNAGRVGIGTTEPIGRFQVMVTSQNHEDGVLIIHEASTGISEGNWIGGIGFDTADGNVPSRVNEASAFIGAYAAENMSTSDKGGHLVFGCTKINDDDDTASHEYMRITSEGQIGIGTTAPANRLQISHTAADNDDGLMIVRADTSTADTNLLGGIGFDSTDGNVPSTITEASCFIAAFAAEDHGTGDKGGDLTFGCSKIDDNDDTASHEYMRITSEGKVGIGTTDPNRLFHVLADDSSGYAAKFKNDGNNADRFGILIDCGTDDNSGTNVSIQFRDGDGNNVGKISSTGGTVTYGAFTGYHPAALPEGVSSYDYGTIVKINSTSVSTYPKSVQYGVEKTTTAQDKAVFGVYSIAIGEEFNESGEPAQEHNRHQVWCLGDGHILVCSEGGNIEVGDYICSSNTVGHGMKQDDDLLHNYTVAKATQAVDWSAESSNTKLISCTYHAS